MTHVCYVHVFEHYDHVRSVHKRMATQRLLVPCMPAEILGMHVRMMHHMQDTHTFILLGCSADDASHKFGV